jgi:hypothetical protein
MTADRALELAELALNMRRASAKHTGQPGIEHECEEALKIVADIRATMLLRHVQRGAENLQEAEEGQPTSKPSESLRRSEKPWCDTCKDEGGSGPLDSCPVCGKYGPLDQ